MAVLPDFIARPKIASGELVTFFDDFLPRIAASTPSIPHRRYLPTKVSHLRRLPPQLVPQHALMRLAILLTRWNDALQVPIPSHLRYIRGRFAAARPKGFPFPMKYKASSWPALATLLAPRSPSPPAYIRGKAPARDRSRTTRAGSAIEECLAVRRAVSASVVLRLRPRTANATLDPDELRKSARRCSESLAEYNYYTSISDNGKSVKVSRPDSITVDYKDNQLLMMFAVQACRDHAA